MRVKEFASNRQIVKVMLELTGRDHLTDSVRCCILLLLLQMSKVTNDRQETITLLGAHLRRTLQSNLCRRDRIEAPTVRRLYFNFQKKCSFTGRHTASATQTTDGSIRSRRDVSPVKSVGSRHTSTSSRGNASNHSFNNNQPNDVLNWTQDDVQVC